jgi:outer membrane PBP1 activator LpoA protein
MIDLIKQDKALREILQEIGMNEAKSMLIDKFNNLQSNVNKMIGNHTHYYQ